MPGTIEIKIPETIATDVLQAAELRNKRVKQNAASSGVILKTLLYPVLDQTLKRPASAMDNQSSEPKPAEKRMRIEKPTQQGPSILMIVPPPINLFFSVSDDNNKTRNMELNQLIPSNRH